MGDGDAGSGFDLGSLKGAKHVVCFPQRLAFSGWVVTQGRPVVRTRGPMSLVPAGDVTGSTTLLMPLLGVGVPSGIDGSGVWSWIVDERPVLHSLLVATMLGSVDEVFARLIGWLDDGEFGQPTKIETRDVGAVWVYPFRSGDTPRIVALF